MTAQHILQLGQMVGLSCSELTIIDDKKTSDDEKPLSELFLTQLLADFDFTGDLAARLEDQIKQFWLQALPPVIVVDELSAIQFDLHLPIEFVTEDLIWEIRNKQETLESGEFTPIEWELNGIYHLQDMEIQSYQISLQQPLTVGEYQLVILDQGSDEPLGEATLLCPPVSLTQQALSADMTELEQTLLAAAMLDEFLDSGLVKCNLVVTSTENTTVTIAKITTLKDYFSAQQLTADPALLLLHPSMAAKDYQHSLASYFTAYENANANAVTMCDRNQTLTADWQELNAESRQFYLWLVCLSTESANKKENRSLLPIWFATDDNNTFSSWLLAEYKLAHCDLNDAAGAVTGQGINSYKLRQDHYAAFIQLIDYMAANSAALILNQPLSIMQQWLVIAGQGVWQNHEFHELLSIILLCSELQGCPCYYQDDEQLPDELTAYLQTRGITALNAE